MRAKALPPAAAEVANVISCHRFAWASERELQDGLERLLRERGWSYAREHRLSAKDRPDFWLYEAGLAIEVKIKGAAAGLLRQVERYLAHEEVRAVIVVTTRRQHVPEGEFTKPVYWVHLWSL